MSTDYIKKRVTQVLLLKAAGSLVSGAWLRHILAMVQYGMVQYGMVSMMLAESLVTGARLLHILAMTISLIIK